MAFMPHVILQHQEVRSETENFFVRVQGVRGERSSLSGLTPCTYVLRREVSSGMAPSLEQEEPATELDLTSIKVVEALSFPCVDNGRKGGYLTVICNVAFME
jgi:hypothetical protein